MEFHAWLLLLSVRAQWKRIYFLGSASKEIPFYTLACYVLFLLLVRINFVHVTQGGTTILGIKK